MTSRCFALAIVGLSACRIDPAPGTPLTGSEQGDEPDSAPGEIIGGRGGSSATANGGRTAGPTPSSGGAADEPPRDECDAQAVTLDEIRAGAVVAGLSVELVATATSQKFLVSQTDAGSCLWGAFVGDEGVDGEPRGVLVVSYGSEAPGAARCEPGADAISDDLVPGDSVRIVGRASSFAPSSCVATFPAPQLIADARCPFERIAEVTPIEPVELPLHIANELARGVDADLVRRWTGGLARLVDVSALPNDAGDGAVRPYGVVALAETELEVHADIEYGDLGAGGPRDPGKGLEFPYPTTFRSITGLVYLDYCDYALAPRRRCLDFDPPSAGCP
jgi:hypothetical protein